MTLSTWMMLFALVPWLFPGASSTTLTVEKGADAPLVLILSQDNASTWSITAAADQTQEVLNIARLTREEVGFAFAMVGPDGKVMASKSFDPAVVFDAVSAENVRGLKSITTSDGVVLKVSYDEGSVTFEEPPDSRYAFWSGPLPVARFVGAQGPGVTEVEGEARAWRYAPGLRLDAAATSPLPLDGRDPGVVALALVQRIMKGDDIPAQGIYPSSDPGSVATLQRRVKHVLKGSAGLDLVGLRYLDGGDLPKMTGDEATAKGQAQVHIEVHPSKARWTFTLQGHEGTWRLRDVTQDDPPTKKTPEKPE